MSRHYYVLALLAALAFAPVAFAGDIIIVEETRDGGTTTSSTAEIPADRTWMERIISFGCQRQAKKTLEIQTISKKTGRDAAKLYCDCMAAPSVDQLTMDRIKTMLKTRKADPEYEAALIPAAQQCLLMAQR